MKIAVIGGGPGGYVAAIKAAMLGGDVTVIEKKKVGGTCLNVGCIPTKALLASSSMLMNIKEAKNFGINIDGKVNADFSAVMSRKDKIVDQLISGIEFLFDKRGINLVNGFGKVTRSKIPDWYLFSIFTKRCSSGTLLQASTALSTRFPYNTPISP